VRGPGHPHDDFFFFELLEVRNFGETTLLKEVDRQTSNNERGLPLG